MEDLHKPTPEKSSTEQRRAQLLFRTTSSTTTKLQTKTHLHNSNTLSRSLSSNTAPCLSKTSHSYRRSTVDLPIMSATFPAKNEKQHARTTLASAQPTAPAVTGANGAASGGKKKKKGKGKAEIIFQSATMHDFADDDDDDLPSLEPCTAPTGFPRPRTGLSPDLESVHLSTTASLSSFSASAKQNHLNMSPAAQAELLTDLYRKVGFDAAGAVADEVRESLDALPGGMRTFVQSALAGMTGLGLGSDEMKQRTLYAIAQQMLQGGVGVGVGVGVGPGARTNGSGKNTNPVPAFDAGALSELALTQALERLVKGAVPTRGAGGQTALHANVVLSHDFIDDSEGAYEDEMYSEDEVDEGVEELEMHMDMERMRTAGMPLGPGPGQFSVSYEELLSPGAYPASDGAAPRKKNKKKKRKGGSNTPYMGQEPEVVERVGITKQPVAHTTTPNPNSHPIQQQNPSVMPPARAAANPPPSSRAAGKQPMSYAPPPPAAANPPASTNPPRSARAAAKAPAPPQSYANHNHAHHHPSPPSSNASVPQKHHPPAGGTQNNAAANSKSNSKIWSTNTTEERERIKEFWLGLGEEERRALVKVEKEDVLRKMKEQQKHSCTCAVCGRKRNAIEEELEVLYDAYYEELEQYANYQQRYASSNGKLPPPPGPGPFPGSVELDKNGLVVGPGGKTHAHPPPARGKAANALANGPKKSAVPESEFDEDDPDGDDYEDEYDEEEEDEEEEEEDVEAEDDVDIRNRGARRGVVPNRERGRDAPNGNKANVRDDLFNFGSSLTVAGPGNILTVADDLLKNDGQKFLEMMEQLAERRMQREEEAAADVEDDSEEEDDEEGDEDDDGEDEEEDEDEDDEEVLTEEQKMEEGKRMFSIFAARMFEQRVLGAYREKVAQERQSQLLREIDDEKQASIAREAKKARENQKKKDKKRQQKLAKEEERAAKAAERASEEATQKEKLEEEQRKKREEERLKREVARKAAEEERQKKEDERRKRIAEEKELQRKRKEKDERVKAERKEREEKERKAKEEREVKLAAERAAEKAKKEREEREKRQKENEDRAQREAKERVAQQQQQQQQQQARTAAAKARPPASPRTNAVASGSQRQQPLTVTPKKILNKPAAQAAVTPITQPTRQPTRSAASMQPATPVTPQHAPSSQHSSPTTATNLPPSTPIFQQPPTIPGPVLSPFAPSPGFGPYLPHLPMPLGPPALPRPFGTGPPFEPGFGRGLAPAAPIGPPKVGMSNPIASPIMIPGPSVSARRMSAAADPGPITRPIAPIARPTNGINGDSSGSGSGSGGASPSRRSPSPKGVLGSSALAADDDEVVSGPGRRVAPGPVGQGWHSPRSSVAASTPWGTAPPTPGFSSPRALSGGNISLNPGLWGQAGPGNSNPNLNEWHSHPSSHFFGSAPFLHQSHSTATPPPHSSGN